MEEKSKKYEGKNSVIEFVEGWDMIQTLGEGAFGEVKLLVNAKTGEAVAMKVIDLKKHINAAETVKKEVCVHRMLNDPHVIRFYGRRENGNFEFIFLEYASGGELFDRIEPDVGMPQMEAQRYFKQLIAGVNYLHSRGVAHRDIKPENLLLDANDNLKISDFGMATIFRFQGRERHLDKRCGTLPYIAPEVLCRKYAAEPADIWSCGVVLVAMLAGELPWDVPSNDCPLYTSWKECQITRLPWTKIDTLALSLLRKVLMPLPGKRYTIQQITNHQWFQKKFKVSSTSLRAEENTPVSKRICSDAVDAGISLSSSDPSRLSYSQPGLGFFSGSQPVHQNDNNDEEPNNHLPGAMFSFSQPAHIDDMLLNSQLNTQTASGSSMSSPLQRLVKRMTRLVAKVSCEEAIKHLSQQLIKLGYTWKIHTPGVVTISTQDRRKMQLVFKATVYDMQTMVLLDFRLSRGCGLDFKRHFLAIKHKLADILCSAPVTWSIATATNSIP
nr:check point kinase 1 [Daphnia tibetana]